MRTWVLILTKFGYQTTGFSHPHAALEAIRKNPPDILVTDVGLPAMTGIELAITLMDEGIPTKVLLCSGQTVTAEYIDAAAEKGYHFRVLAKPVGPALLVQSIRAALGESEDTAPFT